MLVCASQTKCLECFVLTEYNMSLIGSGGSFEINQMSSATESPSSQSHSEQLTMLDQQVRKLAGTLQHYRNWAGRITSFNLCLTTASCG